MQKKWALPDRKTVQKYLIVCPVLLLFVFSMILNSGAFAADVEGIAVSVKAGNQSIVVSRFTMSDLKAMTQTRETFSSVDPMPAPCVMNAEGVLIKDLLSAANISTGQVKSLKFSSSDGWTRTYTGSDLFDAARYDFQGIVTGWDSKSSNPPEFLPGADQTKKAVSPMLALSYDQERFNADPGWSKLGSGNGIMLCFGQKTIEEQTMANYGKYINKIELVLADNTPFLSLDASVNGQTFKPGSAVKLSGIAQGVKAVSVSVTDPQGKVVVSGKSAAVSGGTYSCPFSIPADAAKGQYKIVLSSGSYSARYFIHVSKNDTSGGSTNSPTAEPSPSTSPRAGGSATGVQGKPADALTIAVGYYGGPYRSKKVFSLQDLQNLPQVKQAYTFIDNMPSVVLDSAVGVRLTDILAASGIDVNSVESFYFYCTDVNHGWYENVPKSYLLDTKRYYYPNLPSHWDSDNQVALSGAKAGAVEVNAILSLEDNWQRFGVTPNYSNMDTSTRFRLLFGQTDVSSRTASRSAKWIHEIDVMLGGTPPSGITLDQSALKLKVGSTYQLSPMLGIVNNTTDKRVAWKSSDPSIAKVDSGGRVTVLKEGEAVITATTVVGGLSAVCVVNGPNEPKDSGKPVIAPASGSSNGTSAGGSSQATGGNGSSQSSTGSGSSQSATRGNTSQGTGSNIASADGTEKKTAVGTKIKRQYLEMVNGRNGNKSTAELKGTTASSQVQSGGASGEQSGKQPWRAYEMSPTAVALPKIKDQDLLAPYAGAAAIALLGVGGGSRFKKYRNEV